MLRFHRSRIGWILMLTLGLWAAVAQAREFRYCYVSFNDVPVTPGFNFFEPAAINNSGRVFGVAFDDVSFLPHIAVYEDGAVTVLQSGQPGIVHTANDRGTIGGGVLIDTENFFEQAALFRGPKVKLIPPQPFELTSFVTALNDRGKALVISEDSSGVRTNLLYRRGQATPLDFGPSVTNPSRLAINNRGIISGTQGPSSGATGFRFDPRTGEAMLLLPLPTDPTEPTDRAWGLDINKRGDVLGYSFVPSGRERIGVWDRHGTFKTYFTEGTPEFPTISNSLRFNDNNLIVITFVSRGADRGNSYLVPKPGVRLNLANLVENLPSGADLFSIRDLNNHGNMIGFSFSLGEFLLERIDKDESCTMAAAAS